jgi:hypothetical protein
MSGSSSSFKRGKDGSGRTDALTQKFLELNFSDVKFQERPGFGTKAGICVRNVQRPPFARWSDFKYDTL